MEKVTITFKDGTVLEAEKNASTYIVDSKPEFPADLSDVSVTGEGGDAAVFAHAKVIECYPSDKRYWFTFLEETETERSAKKMQSDIEYIAMMSDIELEEV